MGDDGTMLGIVSIAYKFLASDPSGVLATLKQGVLRFGHALLVTRVLATSEVAAHCVRLLISTET